MRRELGEQDLADAPTLNLGPEDSAQRLRTTTTHQVQCYPHGCGG